jgi:uncharacterized protein (DUF488 family)
MNPAALTLYGVGHSNRSIEQLVALLEAHRIGCVADVRAFPASRRWPHFSRQALAASLAASGLAYVWLPQLGGRRSPSRPDSPHTAWTVAAFRNYADYAETAEFEEGLGRLRRLAAEGPTAFLCAEARWWQCHRRLIADRLLVEGHRVLHLESATRVSEHQLPPFARLNGGRLVYDGATQLSLA